jgi:BirA family biotin operon repressor/biotin-[acetyl-CoA-carboxylase] ligase
LLLEGAATVDRTRLAIELLLRLRERYQQWQAAGGDPDRSGLRKAYLSCCSTVGQQVRVVLPGEAELVGQASDVDSEGRLVVLAGGQTHRVAAGDVVHLR